MSKLARRVSGRPFPARGRQARAAAVAGNVRKVNLERRGFREQAEAENVVRPQPSREHESGLAQHPKEGERSTYLRTQVEHARSNVADRGKKNRRPICLVCRA